MTFVQKYEGNEQMICANWGSGASGRVNCKCKSPGLRVGKEAGEGGQDRGRLGRSQGLQNMSILGHYSRLGSQNRLESPSGGGH